MAKAEHSPGLLDIVGLPDLTGKQVGIIATEWNAKLVSGQVAGARRVAGKVGVDIPEICYVPGSFELPFAARRYSDQRLQQGRLPDALILFGAVIRGGTPHFEYVCKAVTEGCLQLNLMLPIPVIFGVLTLDSEAQAWERLGGSHGHKGEEAMITALKMIAFNEGLERGAVKKSL